MARQFFHPALRRPVAHGGEAMPILFYSQVAWDTVWQRPQEQALGLARRRPVVFLAPVQLHEWVGRLAGRWRFARRLAGGRLLVLSPLIFSGEYRSAAVRRVNRHIVSHIARRVVKPDKFLFLTNSPFAAHLIFSTRPRGVIYDLIDDFCAFSWAPPEGRREERHLLAHADLGFAGTGYLRDRYASAFEELRFLPSGVRFDDLTAPVPEPEDLRALPKPRLLYVGTINDRLNGELFAAASRAVPQGSVVVVGPRHGTFSAPKLPNNVHFLGLKPHTDLPGYYQHCQAGLMPFADTPAARAINPVKTLEYLACGLPVISTPIPDVIRYYPEVVRVEKPAGWTAALREMLAQDSGELRASRRRFAGDRSWHRLVEDMESEIARMEERLPCVSSS